jgi:hypothetical protein
VDKTKTLDLEHIESGNLLSTLGCLFFNRKHEMDTSLDGIKGNNVPEEVKKLAEQMEAAQDSVCDPYLVITKSIFYGGCAD